ncbi:TPM domain-containing protein [Desulfogranum mediterraneum]|uniref:TPM domain-containing protein n=1 Tax=Desulfogranum mediterraneum TaxID=160661 RepID=UPI000419B246|nr:TPM domain-containing protein [Desulfogranum mediterraneum]
MFGGLSLAALLLLLSWPALALLSLPPLTALVNDHADLLSPEKRQLLEQQLVQLEAEDSSQLLLLTVPSLQGASVEEYALEVVERWQPGQQGLNNGALLLVAVKERKIRIEVGYGLEGVLTDLVAGRIIREIMVPAFRDNRAEQGVVDGMEAMILTVRGEFSRVALPAKEPGGDLFGVMVAALAGISFLGLIFRRRPLLASLATGGYGALLALVTPLIQGGLALAAVAAAAALGGLLMAVGALRFSVGRKPGGRRQGRPDGPRRSANHSVDRSRLNGEGREEGRAETSRGAGRGGGGGSGGGGASGEW